MIIFIGKMELVALFFSGLCTVYLGLFAISLGVTGTSKRGVHLMLSLGFYRARY